MKKKAMIVWGGWDGHEPELVSKRFNQVMLDDGFDVDVHNTLDAYLDTEYVKSMDVIMSLWTMGEITNDQCNSVMKAVASGVGLVGSHGGMCDSFRMNTEWQFMTGGQWVAHPGNDGTPYVVNFKNSSSPITYGLKDFNVASEQYYVHVDPANEVLATTRFPVAKGPYAANGAVDVPVIWTRRWGYGRVFYTTLGHHDDVFNIYEAQETMRRGIHWAAEGKAIAVANGNTDGDDFYK
ncbi:MAG: ThuA domain-containing protein [Eubacteriales bacterium]